MKISLITVRPRHSAYGLFSIVPLGPVYLGTILKEKGHQVVVYDEARSHIFDEKKGELHPDLLNSDFIGLSVISPAAGRALRLLEAVTAHNPGIRTAAGGPHILGMEQAEEFSRYADVVVQKEAENIIAEMVNGNLNGIVEGPQVKDLDQLPVPDLNLVDHSRKSILDFFKLTPVSTSRGCPRNCEFCSVSNIHGKRVRRRSPELVMQELRQRLQEGYKRIFFVDDNFSVQPSKRMSLLEAMIDEREKGRWFESMIIQDEVPALLRGGDTYVDMLRRAGIKTVMLGVESFDDEKLKAMHKTHSKTDSEKALRLLRKHGLIIYAFGMAKPEIDDKKSIRNQFRKLKEEGVTYADMTIETPIPGTEYWEKYKDRLTALRNGSPDWDQWTFLAPVIPTKHMSQEAFQKEVKRSMQRFYSPLRALKEILKGKLRKGLTILYVWITTGRMYR
ncbi:MAG: B12-binding domain-containing radical SAM protein [Bacteroidales bacterium]|nr:B12-binding domain-containing radical SAM protein [Bacteroidales bacterium]